MECLCQCKSKMGPGSTAVSVRTWQMQALGWDLVKKDTGRVVWNLSPQGKQPRPGMHPFSAWRPRGHSVKLWKWNLNCVGNHKMLEIPGAWYVWEGKLHRECETSPREKDVLQLEEVGDLKRQLIQNLKFASRGFSLTLAQYFLTTVFSLWNSNVHSMYVSLNEQNIWFAFWFRFSRRL